MAEEIDVREDVETLKKDISKLRQDISEITQKLLKIGKDETDAARGKVRIGAIGQTRKRGRETVESVEEKIEERPFLTLSLVSVLAFIIGLILGILVDRNSSSSTD